MASLEQLVTATLFQHNAFALGFAVNLEASDLNVVLRPVRKVKEADIIATPPKCGHIDVFSRVSMHRIARLTCRLFWTDHHHRNITVPDCDLPVAGPLRYPVDNVVPRNPFPSMTCRASTYLLQSPASAPRHPCLE